MHTTDNSKYMQGYTNGDEEDQQEAMFLHLDGEAADFFHSMCLENCSLADIVERMNWRFGQKELPQTMRATFENMRQNTGELLEQWAERVRRTAHGAFMDLPLPYQQEETIRKFCQGLVDKETATLAAVQGFRTLEQAINFTRSHLEVSKSVYGATRKVRKIAHHQEYDADDSEIEEDCKVKRIQATKNDSKSTGNNAKEAESDLNSKLGAALEAMQNITKLLGEKIQRDRSRSRSPSRNSRGEILCFYCQESGHIKKNCQLFEKERATGIVCFKCQEPGHKRPTCPLLKDEKKITSVENTDKSEKGKTTDIVCFNCQEPGHKRPTCPLLKNEKKVTFVEDTEKSNC